MGNTRNSVERAQETYRKHIVSMRKVVTLCKGCLQGVSVYKLTRSGAANTFLPKSEGNRAKRNRTREGIKEMQNKTYKNYKTT